MGAKHIAVIQCISLSKFTTILAGPYISRSVHIYVCMYVCNVCEREVRLRAGFESSKASCFGTINPVTVWMDQVWETESFNKPVRPQVNETRGNDLKDCKP